MFLVALVLAAFEAMSVLQGKDNRTRLIITGELAVSAFIVILAFTGAS